MIFWTVKKINLLEQEYPAGDLDALCKKLGTSLTAIRNKACKLGIRRNINAATFAKIRTALEQEPWLTRSGLAHKVGMTTEGMSMSIFKSGETFRNMKTNIIKAQHSRLIELEAQNV